MIQRSYLNQNQIQQLKINYNGFFDNQMVILNPNFFINTLKIIQFTNLSIHIQAPFDYQIIFSLRFIIIF